MWNRTTQRRHHRRKTAYPGISAVESLERRDLKTSIFAAAVEGPLASLNQLSAEPIGATTTETPIAALGENGIPETEAKYVDAFFASFGSTTPTAEGSSELAGLIAGLSVNEAEKLQKDIEQSLEDDNAGDDSSPDKPDAGDGSSLNTMSQSEWDLLRRSQQMDHDCDDDEDDCEYDDIY